MHWLIWGRKQGIYISLTQFLQRKKVNFEEKRFFYTACLLKTLGIQRTWSIHYNWCIKRWACKGIIKTLPFILWVIEWSDMFLKWWKEKRGKMPHDSTWNSLISALCMGKCWNHDLVISLEAESNGCFCKIDSCEKIIDRKKRGHELQEVWIQYLLKTIDSEEAVGYRDTICWR